MIPRAGDDDASALVLQTLGGGETNAAGAAGDEDGVLVEAVHGVLDSFVSILQAAALGVGVAALPAFAAAQDPRLVRISEPLDIPKMPIWLLTHPEVRGNARVRALLQHLAERTPAVLDSLTRAGACCEATLRALAAANAGAPAKRARSGKRRD